MPATTIDIGTYSLKVVSGEPGPKPKIERVEELVNPLGIAIPGNDLQIEQLSEQINNIIFDNKLPHGDVRLSLPESVVSTKVISIPNLTDAELASAVAWQAEQHIPIPKEELSLQYKVLFRPPAKDKQTPMRVLLIGTRKTMIEQYVGMFINMGIEPTLIESQMLSVIRSLGMTTEDPPTLIVSIGATNMDISAVANGEFQFVFTHTGAGMLLTKTLQQTLGLDGQQAEQYKRTYGLDPTQFEGRINNAMMPTINTLTTEIQKSIRYFLNQNPQQPISQIVLTGGSSQLPGLVEHFSKILGVEILLAAPFGATEGNIPEGGQQGMAVCVGLLMRELK